MKVEEEFPDVIQRILNRSSWGLYSHCFYQWYGYSFHTYHLVYSYNKYHFTLSQTSLKVRDLIEKMSPGQQITSSNADHLYINSKKIESDLMSFLKNSYDIYSAGELGPIYLSNE
jgi:hypothetical protein